MSWLEVGGSQAGIRMQQRLDAWSGARMAWPRIGRKQMRLILRVEVEQHASFQPKDQKRDALDQRAPFGRQRGSKA